MDPLVSVNVCCYNSEQFLRSTIESVLRQTYQEWELVLVDDGSTDSTRTIVEEYQRSRTRGSFSIRRRIRDWHPLGIGRSSCRPDH